MLRHEPDGVLPTMRGPWTQQTLYGQCIPETAGDVINCGPLPDGCGGPYACGTCAAGEVCSRSSCVPADCAPKHCNPGQYWNTKDCLCETGHRNSGRAGAAGSVVHTLSNLVTWPAQSCRDMLGG